VSLACYRTLGRVALCAHTPSHAISLRLDAKSSLGDAKSLLGDAKSSLGDAKSSLGDAKSSLGDAKSSLGDAKSSLGDVQQRRALPGQGAAQRGGRDRCRYAAR
jgi:uncharacterized protein YjbJ (UPF0337 family)